MLAISLGGLSGANEVQTALSAVRGVYRARASSLPRAVRPASNPSASIELRDQARVLFTRHIVGQRVLSQAEESCQSPGAKFASVAKAGRKALGTARN